MVDFPIKSAIFMEFHGYFKADSAIHDGENPLPFSTKRRKQGKETSNPDNLRVAVVVLCILNSFICHSIINFMRFLSLCVCVLLPVYSRPFNSAIGLSPDECEQQMIQMISYPPYTWLHAMYQKFMW